MNTNKSSLGIIKGMFIGAIAGVGVTMLVTNQKGIKNKVKKTAQNTIDNVSSMFKMN